MYIYSILKIKRKYTTHFIEISTKVSFICIKINFDLESCWSLSSILYIYIYISYFEVFWDSFAISCFFFLFRISMRTGEKLFKNSRIIGIVIVFFYFLKFWLKNANQIYYCKLSTNEEEKEKLIIEAKEHLKKEFKKQFSRIRDTRDMQRAFYHLQLASNHLVFIPSLNPRWCQIFPQFLFLPGDQPF